MTFTAGDYLRVDADTTRKIVADSQGLRFSAIAAKPKADTMDARVCRGRSRMNPFNAALLTELEDWGPLGPPLGQPLEGPMATRGLTQWASADGRIETGTWECEPGFSRWEYTSNGELIHVVSGSMEVTPDGGETVTLGPGDSMTFPIGWSGTWRITETLRKVYTVFDA